MKVVGVRRKLSARGNEVGRSGSRRGGTRNASSCRRQSHGVRRMGSDIQWRRGGWEVTRKCKSWLSGRGRFCGVVGSNVSRVR